MLLHFLTPTPPVFLSTNLICRFSFRLRNATKKIQNYHHAISPDHHVPTTPPTPQPPPPTHPQRQPAVGRSRDRARGRAVVVRARAVKVPKPKTQSRKNRSRPTTVAAAARRRASSQCAEISFIRSGTITLPYTTLNEI